MEYGEHQICITHSNQSWLPQDSSYGIHILKLQKFDEILYKIWSAYNLRIKYSVSVLKFGTYSQLIPKPKDPYTDQLQGTFQSITAHSVIPNNSSFQTQEKLSRFLHQTDKNWNKIRHKGFRQTKIKSK